MAALKDGEIWARGAPEDVVSEAFLATVFRVNAERGPRITPLGPHHDDDDGRGSPTPTERVARADGEGE